MPDESDRLTRSESGLVERQRATPLKPAIWMTSVLVWATVVGLFLRVPTWGGLPLLLDWGIVFILPGVLHLPHGGRSRHVAKLAVPRTTRRAQTRSGETTHRRRGGG